MSQISENNFKMTGKSKKDLQTENSKLKEELSDITLKHESLLKNFEILQKNNESRKENFTFTVNIEKIWIENSLLRICMLHLYDRRKENTF